MIKFARRQVVAAPLPRRRRDLHRLTRALHDVCARRHVKCMPHARAKHICAQPDATDVHLPVKASAPTHKYT
eukprot:6213912-Pleurochrysis_carterae.AAC.7